MWFSLAHGAGAQNGTPERRSARRGASVSVCLPDASHPALPHPPSAPAPPRHRRRAAHGPRRQRRPRPEAREQGPIDIIRRPATRPTPTRPPAASPRPPAASTSDQRRQHLLRPRRVQRRYPRGAPHRQRAHLPQRHHHRRRARHLQFQHQGHPRAGFRRQRGRPTTSAASACSRPARGRSTTCATRTSPPTTPPSRTSTSHARRIRIYPDNRVIYIGATLYVGTTPVFYFPYFYQSLDQQSGYQLTPGYTSTYGAYLLTGITFPVTEHLTGLVRLDYRSSRGAGGGLNLRVQAQPPREHPARRRRDRRPTPATTTPAWPPSGQRRLARQRRRRTTSPPTCTGAAAPATTRVGARGDGLRAPPARRSPARSARAEGCQFLSYYVHDDQPDLNRTSLDRLPIGPDRYRLKLTGHAVLHRRPVLQGRPRQAQRPLPAPGFLRGRVHPRPQPGQRRLRSTYHQPTFVATLVGRAQFNNFFDTTERLPELSLDVPRLPMWQQRRFLHERRTRAGYLRRTFDNTSPLPEYSTFRAGHVPPVHLCRRRSSAG